MSKLRDLIEQGPKLCGAVKHEQWSLVFTSAFDLELTDGDSVFAQKAGEVFEDRYDILNGLYNAKGAQFRKVAFWVGMVQLCALSYGIAKGRTDLIQRHENLVAYLTAQETEQAEIASVMSVQEASTLSIWD